MTNNTILILVILILGLALFAVAIVKKGFNYFIQIAEPISKLISAIAIPLIIAIIGGNIQTDVAKIQEAKDWANHDLSILQEFNKIYYDSSKRRLSLQCIALINDKKTKKELRHFMVWDLLKINIMKAEYIKHRSFRFQEYVEDWHILGENISSMVEEDDKDCYYESVKRIVLSPDHPPYKDFADSVELRKMFEFLERYDKIAAHVKKHHPSLTTSAEILTHRDLPT